MLCMRSLPQLPSVVSYISKKMFCYSKLNFPFFTQSDACHTSSHLSPGSALFFGSLSLASGFFSPVICQAQGINALLSVYPPSVFP